MRPILKPGLRRLWHNGSTLQLGIDPASAVLVTGLRPAHTAVLDALDGRRTLEQVRMRIGTGGQDLLDLLDRAGLLDDAAPRPGAAPLPTAERDRLLPDLAALSVHSADPGRPSRVLVRGAGRVGAQIAALLAAAGVGRVVVDDPAMTTPADVSPGGLGLEDIGRPRALAASAAMDRVRREEAEPRLRPAAGRAVPPGSGAAPGPSRFTADLTVLAPVGPPTVAPVDSLDLEAAGGAHLLTGVRETSGIVGPLVVPGVTACLHCQHLHRQGLDPAWPLLAMQLVRPRTIGQDPCEITLASLVAALTAMQALAYLDRAATPSSRAGRPRGVANRPTPQSGHLSDNSDFTRGQTTSNTVIYATSIPSPPPLPVTADGTLEVAVPDWRIRRRSWPVHPNCPCRTARTAAAGALGPPVPR
jgi:hypothetical protein